METPKVLIVIPVFRHMSMYKQTPDGILRLERYLERKEIQVDVAACYMNVDIEYPAGAWVWLLEKGVRREDASPDISRYGMICISVVSEESILDIKRFNGFLKELRKKAARTVFVAGGFGVWRFGAQIAGKYENLDFVVNRWGEAPVEFLFKKTRELQIRHPVGVEQQKKIFAARPPKGIFARCWKDSGTAVLATGGWAKVPKEALYRYNEKKDLLEMSTQLGCHWGRCTFCLWAKSIRWKRFPVEWALRTISEVNPKEVRIFDACFLYRDAEKSEALLEGIIQLKGEGTLRKDLSLVYECRADAFPADARKLGKLVTTMKNAGTKVLFIGFESGSERVLREFKKGNVPAIRGGWLRKEVLLEQNVHAIDVISAANFEGSGYFIMSSPNSELSDVIKTLKLIVYLAKANPGFWIRTNPAVITRGKSPFCLEGELEKTDNCIWPSDPLAEKIALAAHTRIERIGMGTVHAKFTAETVLGALEKISGTIDKHLDISFLENLADRRAMENRVDANFGEKMKDEKFRESLKDIDLRIWKEYVMKGKHRTEFMKAARKESNGLKRMLQTNDREELRKILLG